ncbi:MAG: hypothetical protein D6743_00260, partial [Calditrichaeota bacterium]
ITLGSLSILSISAAPREVSRGQSGISVSMTVQNLGTNPITDLQGSLIFTGSADRTAEYTVTPSGSNPTTLGGGSTATLSFTVKVVFSATLETVTIDGTVNGKVNGTPVSASGAAVTDQWTVQRSAELTVEQVIAAADTVSQGQTNLTVTVRIGNRLGQSQSAEAIIDSVRLVFKQGPVDKTSDYVISPNPGNPTRIAGNSTVNFTFTVNVGLSATPGATLIDAQVFGKDANSFQRTSDLTAAVTDTWVVVEGNAFTIVSITPSQSKITAGMLKEWQVRMQVQNSGSSNISLDLDAASTFIQLKLGANDVTSQYTIISPTALDEGGTLLSAGSTGHLTFRITKSGTSTGIVTITGEAAGQDLSTGLPISDNTNDSGTGEVEVQTQGSLNIELVQTSQPAVTASRSFNWKVTATVRNAGGSAIQLASNPVTISIGDNQGYQYLLPGTFVDGDSILNGNETKQIEIVVDRTGTATGDQPIAVVVSGVELNSGRSLQSNTGGASILVQSPAVLEIVEFRASRPTVTAGQANPWSVTLVVSNLGQSRVELQPATTSLEFRIDNQIQSDYQVELQPQKWLGNASTFLPGNTTDSLRFSVNRTGAVAGFLRLLGNVQTREINSDAPVSISVLSSPLVQVQTPPDVSYLANSMVPDIVNNNGFYTFKVRLRNSGQATVFLEPALTSISFSDGTNTFFATLDANEVTSLPPGDTRLTFQHRQVPAAMKQQTYTPKIELRGTENGNSYARTLLVTPNELQVTAPASVQIIALQPSQPTVTSQMDKDWHITMVVANNGGTDIELD